MATPQTVGYAITAATAIAKHPKTKMLLSRACHKINKRMRLRKVHCIVVDDSHRKMLDAMLPEGYKLIDLEAILETKMPEAEYERLTLKSR